MSLVVAFAKIHRFLDFAQGNKTKIGALLVLVGKAVSLWRPAIGQPIERVGIYFTTYGLTLAATRPLADKVA